MSSPSKIIFLAFFVAVFVAYFGDKFVALSHKAGENIKQTAQKSANEMVYEKTNMAGYNGDIRVPMSRDGHYWLNIDVNGTAVRFVVDTGASHIALSYQDAVNAGLDPSSLTYDRIFQTANGQTRKAFVKLDSMTLNPIEMSDVLASVSQEGQMNVSLLGMNFLNRLSGFRVENRQLILKP